MNRYNEFMSSILDIVLAMHFNFKQHNSEMFLLNKIKESLIRPNPLLR